MLFGCTDSGGVTGLGDIVLDESAGLYSPTQLQTNHICM